MFWGNSKNNTCIRYLILPTEREREREREREGYNWVRFKTCITGNS